MGGRMASMIADEMGPLGVVCLGYPFHAPGRPDRPRIDHLRAMSTPALIVQGTRDPFGKPEEVTSYGLSPMIEVRWVADGDHDLKPPRTSPRTHEGNLEEAIRAVLEFIEALKAPSRA